MLITRNDFEQCRKLAIEIDEIKNRMDKILAVTERCTTSYSALPRATGILPDDKYAEGADEIILWESESRGRIQEYIHIVRKVEFAIDWIKDSNQRRILRLRYIDALYWSDITRIMDYGYRWCYDQHCRAMKFLGLEDEVCTQMQCNV